MEGPQSARKWSMAWRSGLALLVAAFVFDAKLTVTETTAQASQPNSDDVAHGLVQLAEEHVPGRLYQDGPGQISFDELPLASQEGVSAADEWVQLHHGYQVQQAYSNHTRAMAAHAKIQKAAYQSGTNGLADVGIER
jgi:hypothetical protein